MTKQNTCNCEGPGRGVAGDVYAGNAGAEFWGSGTGLTNLFSSTGGSLGRTPGSANFLVWWDADPVRELLDGNHVDKYGTGGDTRLLTADGASSINGTKATPNLSADVLGDWREEVLFRSNDSRFLRIYTTIVPATNRFYTFMHDPQYRVEIARQNTAYNQPPHTELLRGQRHERAAHAQHHVPGHAAGNADLPGGNGGLRRRRGHREHQRRLHGQRLHQLPAERRLPRVPERGRRHRRHADAALPRGAGRRQHAHRTAGGQRRGPEHHVQPDRRRGRPGSTWT